MNFVEAEQVDDKPVEIDNVKIDNLIFKWRPASLIKN